MKRGSIITINSYPFFQFFFQFIFIQFRNFLTLCLTYRDVQDDWISPCGACRQVISEVTCLFVQSGIFDHRFISSLWIIVILILFFALVWWNRRLPRTSRQTIQETDYPWASPLHFHSWASGTWAKKLRLGRLIDRQNVLCSRCVFHCSPRCTSVNKSTISS